MFVFFEILTFVQFQAHSEKRPDDGGTTENTRTLGGGAGKETLDMVGDLAIRFPVGGRLILEEHRVPLRRQSI